MDYKGLQCSKHGPKETHVRDFDGFRVVLDGRLSPTTFGRPGHDRRMLGVRRTRYIASDDVEYSGVTVATEKWPKSATGHARGGLRVQPLKSHRTKTFANADVTFNLQVITSDPY